jgi:hypothetical protein
MLGHPNSLQSHSLLMAGNSCELTLSAPEKDRFPSVDAPFQAKENVGIAVARGRMLSSVRPLIPRDEHKQNDNNDGAYHRKRQQRLVGPFGIRSVIPS